MVIHRATDTSVAIFIENNTIYFVAMPNESMKCLAIRDSPHTNRIVITTTHKRVSMGSNGTNGMMMSCKQSNKVGTVYISRSKARKVALCTLFRQPPYTELRI